MWRVDFATEGGRSVLDVPIKESLFGSPFYLDGELWAMATRPSSNGTQSNDIKEQQHTMKKLDSESKQLEVCRIFTENKTVKNANGRIQTQLGCG
ncbi:hypothetical protein KIN20_029353 [Parelaphostrongylus tenuis]|uniref:Uncharacterized protein n=1 Tax=Parelaphostrongylus tenuis TaxID=148309 RepID=A0AAD5R2G9_PARTN|nr:hypothetical protein KIN20_029353 [Parelaphostrongylus tenuis]